MNADVGPRRSLRVPVLSTAHALTDALGRSVRNLVQGLDAQ
jgi:hypothetical protein